ncbi:early nodulin-like protein 1 [Malania oleifera]|uniref:early nodulin-like protein 1 n=1 Tax=Malania oleifera TaxID=397392 RepID=UPI0025AE91CF|nr:early nodulin-like protein 1 [Malania oleifera]
MSLRVLVESRYVLPTPDLFSMSLDPFSPNLDVIVESRFVSSEFGRFFRISMPLPSLGLFSPRAPPPSTLLNTQHLSNSHSPDYYSPAERPSTSTEPPSSTRSPSTSEPAPDPASQTHASPLHSRHQQPKQTSTQSSYHLPHEHLQESPISLLSPSFSRTITILVSLSLICTSPPSPSLWFTHSPEHNHLHLPSRLLSPQLSHTRSHLQAPAVKNTPHHLSATSPLQPQLSTKPRSTSTATIQLPLKLQQPEPPPLASPTTTAPPPVRSINNSRKS